MFKGVTTKEQTNKKELKDYLLRNICNIKIKKKYCVII